MNGTDIVKEIEKYKKEGAHMLLQTENVMDHTRAVKPMLEAVHLSSDPENRDVYSDGDSKPKKFRLAKNGLMKLSIAAGVIWHPTLSGRVDNGHDRQYYAHRVIGAIRRPDGTLYPLNGQYDLDFEVEEEKKKLEYDKKRRKWEGDAQAKWFTRKSDTEKDEYISDCIRRDVIQKRQYKAQLCESGAYNRVVRGILPGLKNAYTAKELENPFVIVRYIHVPDYSDPEVQRRLVDASIQATLGVFGPPQIESTPINIPPEDIQDVPQDTPPDDENQIPDSEQDPDSGQKAPLGGPDPREVFGGYDKDTKIRTLTEMAEKKDYDLGQLQKPLNRFSDNQFLQFFDMLVDMVDAEEETDDIPF